MTQPPDPPASKFETPEQILSASSALALSLWLQSQRGGVTAGLSLREKDVRRVMRLVCDEARRRNQPVERLIVLLKEQWSTLPDGDGANRRSRDALDDIIRACIDEFYASSTPSSPTRANRISESSG